MSITERIETDLRAAMKAREAERLSGLRNFKAALKYKEIDKKGPLTEEEELAVLSSAVKKLRESIEEFRKGGREELVAKTEYELKLALSYLPEQMGETEIEKLASEVIAELNLSGPSAFGAVMKGLMPKVKGKADGKLVKAVVDRLLAK